jgi:murein DD-endopeptidase MepM/ murein hydrolase activator NlpD
VAGLSPEQQRVLSTILRVARRVHASPKERLAAVETGLVETHLRNLRYGDGSSLGWRQETSSSYPNVNRLNVAGAARRFFSETRSVRGKYGTAGALAQAVQRSAYPDRYQAARGQALEILRGAGGAGGAGGGSAGGGRAIASSTTTRDAGPQGSALALLQALSQQRQQPQSAGLQAPAFSASPALPKGYQPVVGGGGGAQPPDMGALLAAIQTSGDTGSSRTTTDVVGGGGGGQAPAAGTGGPMGRGGYAYPLARRGKIIGTPYSGTHTLGNWQSDNAVDIAIPVGTPVRSIRGGRVVKVVHHPQDGSRFAGDQVTIQGPGGGVFFTHLSRSNVRPGERVKRGQVIGRSGSANGVAHLHIGRERGNPLREFG